MAFLRSIYQAGARSPRSTAVIRTETNDFIKIYEYERDRGEKRLGADCAPFGADGDSCVGAAGIFWGWLGFLGDEVRLASDDCESAASIKSITASSSSSSPSSHSATALLSPSPS